MIQHRALLLCATLLALALPDRRAAGASPDLHRRWVYLQTNLLVDANVEKALTLLERAAKAGYNGVVVTDSKFMRWDGVPARYVANAQRVREACRRLKLDFIASVFPIGYSNDLLSRDPNLAEGLPVVDAPFIVRGGRLVPADDSVAFVNGGFEESSNNTPAGWRFVDQPGRICFIDTAAKSEGRASLRMQDIGTRDPQHGNGRACQPLKVRPFRAYHVSMAVKTQDFEALGNVRIQLLAAGGVSLNYYQPPIARTQDWKRVDIVFNSLDNADVNLYLGVWGGKGGKIWWDDVRIEPAGLVNVLRRDGTPLKAASSDGKIAYAEGRDFGRIEDPKLGTVPWPGGFTVWHEPPAVAIPRGSRLKEGQKVLLSYYHPAIIYDGAVMCCMSEPKLYDILKWQAEQVRKHLAPDGWFMGHDEIRVQGWDESCRKRSVTPGRILADNVRRCAEIIRQVDPGKPICVWSDMFDPNHNAAKAGRYYLVKGEGPWHGSWAGLPRDVIVVNWNSREASRKESLKHFADLGLRQILAGYYDADPRRIVGWLRDATAVNGVVGTMYTTWRNNYADLEAFAAELAPKSTPR